MSDNCTQTCSTCGVDCAERREPKSMLEQPHELSRVKKVIGVVSGKGGVGKSLVTSLLAVTMQNRGYKTAILDADITGPSIPKTFGITSKAMGNAMGLLPVKTQTGIDVMSINLLISNDTDPVLWRGPILAGAVKQFWTDVIWYDVDYMFIDMPPGTGDVPLTVFQSIPVDGILIVTSPQELVGMIVSKAVKMAQKMNVPVLGLVENMAYFKCPDCGRDHNIFGASKVGKTAAQYGLEVLARLPIDPQVAELCDQGRIEDFSGNWLDEVADVLIQNGGNKMNIAVASEQDMVTGHFGHCINFNIFEAEGARIIKHESIPNPGHKPGFLPNFLSDLGVNVVISGGMGAGAVDIFNEKGIAVILGAQGLARDAAQQYLLGGLASTGSICQDHQHHDECDHGSMHGCGY
ncbi:MAG: P-loop NTPase [Syntrophomonadaceae bacterium]